MRLATVRTATGTRAVVWCRTRDGEVWVDIAEAAAQLLDDHRCPPSVRGLLGRDGPGLSTPRQIRLTVEDDGVPAGVASWPGRGARLAPPVPDPGVLIDFDAFEEHVRETAARSGLEIAPEWFRYPVYHRSNQRALLAHGADVPFPIGEPRMDYALELAAVLGTTLESPSADAAEAAIAGYTLLNDWSARQLQAEVMKAGLGPAKGKDFATSLGPWLVTPDEVGELARLELVVRVNGEVRSRARVGAMRWRWGELIAFAGEGVRLEPGDVFGSGTVAGGCGLEHNRYLVDGDLVELDGGTRLGVLAGTVRQAHALQEATDAHRDEGRPT